MIDGRGARSYAAARRGARIAPPSAGWGECCVAFSSRKTWGVGNSSVVHFSRAVIGHRGSLLPRRFDTSESRGIRADLTAGVGRRAPRSIRRPARTIDYRAPRPHVGSLGLRVGACSKTSQVGESVHTNAIKRVSDATQTQCFSLDLLFAWQRILYAPISRAMYAKMALAG